MNENHRHKQRKINKDFNSKDSYGEITTCKAAINLFFTELSISAELFQICSDLSKCRLTVSALESLHLQYL